MNQDNFSTKHSVVDCKKDYDVFQLDVDFDNLLFDKNFAPKVNSFKKSVLDYMEVSISKDFVLPQSFFQIQDKYLFTFLEDLDFQDRFADVPNDKELSKLLPKNDDVKPVEISDNFVIPKYQSFDQYDSIFIEDLEFYDNYAKVSDDCYLNVEKRDCTYRCDTNSLLKYTNLSDNKNVVVAEKKKNYDMVLVHRQISDNFSLRKPFEKDKYLRN